MWHEAESWLPPVLHHWTEGRNIPDIHEQGLTHPTGTYLTSDSDVNNLNPDVPIMEHPFRLDIDTSQLDPSLFGASQSEGWGGTPQQALEQGLAHYNGTIPRSAIVGIKKFKAPPAWNRIFARRKRLAGMTLSHRTAAERGVYYHVAPASQRESILEHGLQGQQRDQPGSDLDIPSQHPQSYRQYGQPAGNYLFQNPAQAQAYAFDRAINQGIPQQHEWVDYGIHVPDDRDEGAQVWSEPQAPEGWNEDEHGDWYDSDDYYDAFDNQEGRPYDHNTDRLDLLPKNLHGHDIWKVRIDPDRQLVQRDPEDSIVERKRKLPGGQVNHTEPELSMWEAIHQVNQEQEERGWSDETDDRWYTPHAIGPEQLELHQHVPLWQHRPNDDDGEYYPDEQTWHEDNQAARIPEPFSRVPFKNYFGKTIPSHRWVDLDPMPAKRSSVDPSRVAMPADPAWWSEFVQRHPVLYHGTDVWSAERVLREGLRPSDEHGEGHNWSDDNDDVSWFEPRPGHVYLTTERQVAQSHATTADGNRGGYGPVILAIDTARLHPTNINPDEDDWRFTENASLPYTNDGESLGQLAEEHGWGDNPVDTYEAVSQSGALAHRGAIPPDAISVYDRPDYDPHMGDFAWREGATPAKRGSVNSYYHVAPSKRHAPHPHITFGHPCTCPWGTKLQMARTAGKYEWLAKRPDMQTPEGQQMLRFLDEHGYREADKLLPWIVREWRKGRLSPNQAGFFDIPGKQVDAFTPRTLAELQRDLDQMKKARQGVDVMQFGAPELVSHVAEWREEQESKNRQHLGEIVHQFPDGWTVRQLNTRAEMKDEGDMMGHCVGGYGNEAENGSSVFLSLRDRKNHPHATLQMTPDGFACDSCGQEYQHSYRYRNGEPCYYCDGTMRPRVGPGSQSTDYKGRANEPVADEYHDRMNEYLETRGTEATAYDKWWDDYYTMDGPASLMELVGYRHEGYRNGLPDMHPYADDKWHEQEPGDYSYACIDAEEHGVEPPELSVGDPNYEKIIDSMISPDMSWIDYRNGRQHVQVQPGYRPEWANYLLQHAKEKGHENDLREALQEHMISYGADNWRRLRPHQYNEQVDPIAAQYYNHLGGALLPRWKPIQPYNPQPSPKPTPPGQQVLFDRTVARTATLDQPRVNSTPVTIWGEHVGTPEAINAIRQNGFDLSLHRRGTWGRGVYVHINGKGGTTTPGGKGGAKVPVQFTLNRPLHVALNYRGQIDDDDPGHQEFNRITGGPHSGTPEERAALLQRAGYDGVVVHKPDWNGRKPHVAVAFDPSSAQLDAPHFPYGYREHG